MHFTHSLLAAALAFSSSMVHAQAKAVFAHFIVGNAGSWTQQQWAQDIANASAAGIDGFALNIAGDGYTSTQLGYAYDAADAAGNFKLFISFDYAANPAFVGDVQGVSSIINTYKGRKSQYLYDDAPLVSTFEGTTSAGDWPAIKSATGCFFVPDWTSAKGTPNTFANVDGALSWDVWPFGPTGIDPTIDSDWKDILGSKVYMMGVSPWFYTNLPSKNWLWRGDNLWYDRWQQVLEVDPDMVEILTWNDFGESHYIGPLHPESFPAGSESYVAENPHDGWRELLPYYIAAYKNGNNTIPTVDEEKIIWAHKPNPGDSGSSDGTIGNAPYQSPTYSPSEVNLDAINLDVIVKAASEVSVQIGSNPASVWQANMVGPNHFLVYLNGQTGPVTYTVSRNGQTVLSTTGATIGSPQSGSVNWNAVTGTS
ncbi:hypothetical protein MMC13_004430 [Lambiella insularis]|nr:hypothetical protein [Lambiella insularis]